MAKKMNFVDVRGVTYPDSHWRLIRFTIDVDRKYGSFVFAGYRDKAAYLEGKAKVGEKTFEVFDAEFDNYFVTYMTTPGMKIDAAAYQIASEITVETGEVGQVGENPDGSPIMGNLRALFFEDAVSDD